jgi:hypothetical protein
VLNALKHRTAEKMLSIIQRTDLPWCQRTLRFVVFEGGTAVAERLEVGEAGGAAVAGLGIQNASGIQRLSAVPTQDQP